MNQHEKINITIENSTFPVDKELANIIISLNKLGYKTSGCCIGENEEYAWIIIQEINEIKMIQLINYLNGDCLIEKEFYKKSKENTIYVQYILKTLNSNLKEKIKQLNQWDKELNTTKQLLNNITYKCMESLFI